MDVGPVTLVYYSMCAAPGAVAGLLTGLAYRVGTGRTLLATLAGGIGGAAGGAVIAGVPTPAPGQGYDTLVLGAMVLLTALCGWLAALSAMRLRRRSGDRGGP